MNKDFKEMGCSVRFYTEAALTEEDDVPVSKCVRKETEDEKKQLKVRRRRKKG